MLAINNQIKSNKYFLKLKENMFIYKPIDLKTVKQNQIGEELNNLAKNI